MNRVFSLRRYGRNRGVIAIAAVLSSAALAAEPSYQELEAKVAALESRLAHVEQKPSSAAVDAAVRDVLKDAQQRSQLLSAEGFTSGFNKGKFVIQSADGKNKFIPTALLQGRYVGNLRDDQKRRESAFEDGFELRRVKVGITGTLATEDLSYKFQWASTRGDSSKKRDVDTDGDGSADTTVTDVTSSGGSLQLEDAWVRYRVADHWSVFGGQFEDPVSHENLVSSARQLAVEASAVDALLLSSSSDYLQGAGVTLDSAKVRISGVLHDGAKSANTNFQDFGDTDKQTNWGGSARVEVLALGDNWKQYDDFTALGNKSDLLVFGIGGNYTQGDDRDTIYHAADVQWEPAAVAGLSVYAGYVGQQIDNNRVSAANDPDDLYNSGYLIQAGYLLNSKWEVFGRYDVVSFDASQFAAGAGNDLTEVTAGVNYYISGHNAKFTADVTWLPDGFDAAGIGKNSLTGIGALPTNGDANEVIARAQFQLSL